eukprot:CAMPEP_0177161582 /NCGR_PEP_ID=MMETSP0367-20130122/5439_1 /TAXON_ID=447022 ORGANISM="Scrippsiella hangoei-like, Strain SHHI-4" /NCGR_SAMPLE_ID=MMETSP0367 /ASSEMBLY_ACC=CAM_ASM_000362 /LENGTH=350 /DNA_ID=CAMNT_0018607317 /DNA_START=1 /DNA_END=1053 /DNA_ORIENTATION=-
MGCNGSMQEAEPYQAPPAYNPQVRLAPVGAASPTQAPQITIQIACGNCRTQVTVALTGLGLCQYECPTCNATNEFRIGDGGKDLTQMDEIEVVAPSYWETQNMQSGAGRGLVPEGRQVINAMQQLLDQTWKNQWTRDRGKDGKVLKFEVVMVQRNENVKVWTQYYRTRELLAQKAAQEEWATYTSKTETEVQDCPEAKAFLDKANLNKDVNEFYLFHGTRPTAARAICDNDFLINMAGTNAGTLYGPGIYLAEASSKSDEYSGEDTTGIFQGLYAMLVCRVTCGNINYTDEVAPDVQGLVDSILKVGSHHAVLGDREKCRGTYKEFIVFNEKQAYPEYVILYRRVPVDSR